MAGYQLLEADRRGLAGKGYGQRWKEVGNWLGRGGRRRWHCSVD